MARIRTVKPAYPKNRKTRAVCRDARLLNIHLWNLADDEGRLQELLQWIIGEVFPTDEDVTPVVLREWLGELHVAGLITRYQVGEERYIQCNNFREHQVINKPRPSDISAPGAESGESGSAPVVLPEPSLPEKEGEGEKEEEGEGDAPGGAHQQILTTLDRVAFARNIASPKVQAARQACGDFSHLDLDGEVRNFAHYWTEGPGERRPLADVAWAWRKWLENVRPKPGAQEPRAPSRNDFAKYDAVMEEAA